VSSSYRYDIHPIIKDLTAYVVEQWLPGKDKEKTLLFSTMESAERCKKFICNRCKYLPSEVPPLKVIHHNIELKQRSTTVVLEGPILTSSKIKYIPTILMNLGIGSKLSLSISKHPGGLGWVFMP
jgi:hypothetical protein